LWGNSRYAVKASPGPAFAADPNLRVDLGYPAEYALAIAAKAIIAAFCDHAPAETPARVLR
jgi:hypothetical protein